MITKIVKRYGNSGGVYLPASWVGGEVRIDLLKEPLEPKKDLLKLPLENLISVILYGSYVRGEMSAESDIDVIVVVDDKAKINVPQELREKYDIHVRTPSALRKSVENDPVFYKVIKDESAALLNNSFLEELKQIQTKIDGIKFRLNMMESSLNIVKSFISLDAEPSDLAYPLVLRLKEVLFIECFLADKIYTTGMLKKEILRCGISLKDFEALLSIYRAVRGNRKPKASVSMDAVKKLATLMELKISNVKQKAVKKRN